MLLILILFLFLFLPVFAQPVKLIFNAALFNQYISHGVSFGNFGPFDDAMGEMGALDDTMINGTPCQWRSNKVAWVDNVQGPETDKKYEEI